MFLRGLLGVAAIAIIAAVGYYFWGEYQQAQRAQRVADYTRQRGFCLDFLNEYVRGKPDYRPSLDSCAARGLINADDIDSARRRANAL